jgi:hypothetical protein
MYVARSKLLHIINSSKPSHSSLILVRFHVIKIQWLLRLPQARDWHSYSQSAGQWKPLILHLPPGQFRKQPRQNRGCKKFIAAYNIGEVVVNDLDLIAGSVHVG